MARLRLGPVTAGLVLMLSMLAAPGARADRAYSARYATTDRGQVTLVANALESCPSTMSSCAAARNGTATPSDNAWFPMGFVDVDSDSSTFNSSRASLALPSGATVLWAGLYWAADTSAGPFGSAAPAPTSRGAVRFATPAASYGVINAATVDSDATSATRYQGFADVTSQVRAAGNGTYAVANVQAGTGSNRWAGWSLVVAYRDATQPVRRLQVYDGLQTLQPGGSSSLDVPLGGFLTPATGTVRGRLAVLSWEGDRGIFGDSATLGARALSDAVSPADDVFNSTIARDGASVTTRNPAYLNAMSLDADELSIDGVLGNAATSSTLHLTTGGDTFLPGAIALATDEGPPVVRTPPTINGTARDGSTLTADRGTWDGTPTVTYAYRWRRCASDGTSCSDIAGATGAAYAASPDDVGSTLRAVVTATNDAGSTSATSSPTAVVQAAPPVNTAAPTVSGTARDGATLTLDRGTWTGTPAIAYAFQWRRCAAGGASCSDIGGATGTSYALTSADVGSTIRAVVTATNAGGSNSATTAQTASVAPIAPANTAAPTISGTMRDGSTLTAASGSWSGTTPVTYAYQWRRCGPDGTGCTDIAGATGAAYTLVGADVGHALRVVVTATNAAGSASAASAPTATVIPAPPASNAAPVISGAARDGRAMTVSSEGGWTGTQPIAFAHQWRRCNSAGTACSDIAGATGTTYVLTSADVGFTMRARVTASNAGGSASADSAPSATVAAAPPVNTTAPTITGTARQGETVTAQPGTWSGTPPLSYAYQWQRCDLSGANCADIAGATGQAYTLTVADVAGRVRVRVIASNAGGAASAFSAPASVNPAAPANTAPPTIAGTARDEETLTVDDGTWSGTPPFTFTHQWLRCDATGASCATISGATGTAYTLVSADVGSTMRVAVTSTNSAGSAQSTSAPTAKVAGNPPASSTPPTITGTARDGLTLTADHGSWSGSTPLSYAYRWQRCDASGSGCADIAGATQTTYTLAAADVDHTIRVQVSASNGGGSASASSAPTPRVAAQPPTSTTAPSVSGTARDGSTLTADHGTWSGTAPLSYAYQWQRCDAAGNACADIAGATEASYESASADVGHAVRVVVTAANAAGSASRASAATAAVAPDPPRSTSNPGVTGVTRDGEVLMADAGSWTGTGPLGYVYRWQRCDADGGGCADIPGATDSRYRLTAEDVGHTVRAVVTASNAGGSASAASAASDRVTAAPPQSTAAPAVAGTPRDGQTLTGDHGTWSGTAPLSYAYRWQRCAADGGGCADISGGTDPSYQLTPDDVGHAVRLAVTASNAAGAATATSQATDVVGAQAPANSALPTLSGNPRDGATLTADHGTWTGTPPLTYTYQWRRCDATGSACQDIGGATGTSYDVTGADVARTLRVVVTATNAGGSADAASEPSGPVSALTPANTTPPAISGTAHGGETLTASQGEWTGTLPIAYAYQWRRCDADGSACADIAGATATTYTVTSADADHALRVVVTASNVAGHSSAISEPTDSVVAKPGNETAPSIAGNVRDGAVLTADHGEWGGSQPIDYAYQWQRCDAGGTSCSDVDGATRADYELTSADVGHAIVVVVTASNAGGRDAAISAPTSAVAAAAPRAAGAPTVTGTAQTGETLTAGEGRWDGTTPMTYAYRWQRCDADGSACVDIAGANARAYTPGESDVGHTLVVVVTATNQAGSASQASSPSARITPGASSPTPTPTPTPTPAPPAPVGSAGGSPAAVDLSTLPGSLLTNGTCQTPTTPSRVRSLKVAGVGTVRVRVASGSVVVPEAPLQVMIAAPRGRTLKASATLDRRRLRLAGRNPRTAEVRPSQLGQPGTRMLRVRVTPPRGKARTAGMRLRFAACRAAFTARQSRAGRGTLLRLRVDSRSALSRVGFTVPAAQALRGGRAKAAVGSLRIVALGSPARTLRLTLPADRRSGTLAASGGMTVSFSRSGFTVTGLPAATGIVQLTLAEPASAARGGALALRATTSSASGAARLAIRIRGVRP